MKCKLNIIWTVLLILGSSEAVFTCSRAIGADGDVRAEPFPYLVFGFLVITVAAVPTIYFLRGMKGLWALILLILLVIVLTPITFYLGVMMCGEFTYPLLFDLALVATLAIIQAGTWVLDVRNRQDSILR